MRIKILLAAFAVLFFCSCSDQQTVSNVMLSQVEKDLRGNKTDVFVVWKYLRLSKAEIEPAVLCLFCFGGIRTTI